MADTASISINSLIDQHLDSAVIEDHIDLDFGPVTIRVRSDSARLVGMLRRYFREFPQSPQSHPDITITALQREAFTKPDLPWESAPRPAHKKPKEESVFTDDGTAVWKVRTGMCFFFTGDRHLAIGPCLDNEPQVVNFTNNRHIDWLLRRDHLLAHAAGVSRGDKGIALAAFSGMGKSTLALHMLDREGLAFVSNDRLLIGDDNGRIAMEGVAKLPRINPGTILNNPKLSRLIDDDKRAGLESLPLDSLWELEDKYDVPLDLCFGKGRFQLSGTITAVVMLNWRRDGDATEMVPKQVSFADRRDLLGAFIKEPGVFSYRTRHELGLDLSGERYIERLRNIPVWELTGKVDFDAAVAFCDNLLR